VRLNMDTEKVGSETNEMHRCEPDPGDFWNEMMHPVLLVLARNARGALVITETVDKGDGWVWNFDKARTVTLDELREITTHCFCYPRLQVNAVARWREHIGVDA